MARTIKKNAQFRKELSEAMNISPTRRAQETRETMLLVRNFMMETPASPPAEWNDAGEDYTGDEYMYAPSVHSFSDEYECG